MLGVGEGEGSGVVWGLVCFYCFLKLLQLNEIYNKEGEKFLGETFARMLSFFIFPWKTKMFPFKNLT